MTYDPKRRLVMASQKTVLGHSLPVGAPLAIVDEPSAPGEVDSAMHRRLFNAGMANYEDQVYATPVETPAQERARLALEALRDAPPGDGIEQTAQLIATDDLLIWQEDDEETGKKAGDRVTNDDLRAVAAREQVLVETDDNKADLIRKIMERRAQMAVQNGTNAETEGAGGQGDTDAQGSTGAGGTGEALTGADGDAHGTAGEGQSDEAE